MIYRSKFRSWRDLSHCNLRILRFQHNSMKNHPNNLVIFNQESKYCRRIFSKIHVCFDDVSIKRQSKNKWNPRKKLIVGRGKKKRSLAPEKLIVEFGREKNIAPKKVNSSPNGACSMGVLASFQYTGQGKPECWWFEGVCVKLTSSLPCT